MHHLPLASEVMENIGGLRLYHHTGDTIRSIDILHTCNPGHISSYPDFDITRPYSDWTLVGENCLPALADFLPSNEHRPSWVDTRHFLRMFPNRSHRMEVSVGEGPVEVAVGGDHGVGQHRNV